MDRHQGESTFAVPKTAEDKPAFKQSGVFERITPKSDASADSNRTADLLELRNRILAGGLHDIAGLLCIAYELCDVIDADQTASAELKNLGGGTRTVFDNIKTIIGQSLSTNHLIMQAMSADMIKKKEVNLYDFLYRLLKENLEHFLVFVPDEIETIKIDEIHFSRVIRNLIINAYKYGNASQCPVEIRIAAEKGFVQIYFKDRGAGIDPDADVFGFHRQGKDRKDGFGVGLTISKIICQAHGGDMQVKNNLDGPGATFIISLPI